MVIKNPIFIFDNLNQSKQTSGVITLSNFESEVELPYVVKDKVLMGPGNHNDVYYGPEAIKNAFNETDWSDKDIIALFLDHKDKEARNWAGFVQNQYFDGEFVKGDIFVYDKDTAIKLHAGAKLGISPKVKGDEIEGEMIRFIFQNFSIVPNPAVKAAYINLNQKEVKMTEENKTETEEVKPEEEKTEKEPEAKPEEKPAEEAKPEATAETAETEEAKMQKKKKPFPKKDEDEDEDEEEEEMSEYLKLSEGELFSKLDKIMSALKQVRKDAYPESTLSTKREREMSKRLDEMGKQLKLVETKLNEPDKATVRAEGYATVEVPSIMTHNLSTNKTDADMMAFLQENIGRNQR